MLLCADTSNLIFCDKNLKFLPVSDVDLSKSCVVIYAAMPVKEKVAIFSEIIICSNQLKNIIVCSCSLDPWLKQWKFYFNFHKFLCQVLSSVILNYEIEFYFYNFNNIQEYFKSTWTWTWIIICLMAACSYKNVYLLLTLKYCTVFFSL